MCNTNMTELSPCISTLVSGQVFLGHGACDKNQEVPWE